MFEKIFYFPAVLRRHPEGPLAPERLEYLKCLNDRGVALGTLTGSGTFLWRLLTATPKST
jgi:hypothetical protein